ncbi:FxsA family protein [Shimia sp.]|uniref:FxsA family protein n=1 Tax=Shimia sp. TaxID=1954381 RepID=UPI0032970E1D
MWLLLIFVAVPLIEIALFIQVGGLIGLWPTLGIVLLTAIAGTWLVRTQGVMAIGNLQRSFSELNDPTEPLAHGAMILIAGALLLTPGFFTDSVGFALLMPPVRMAVFGYLRKRVSVKSFSMGATSQTQRPSARADIIDGEFSEVETPKKPTHQPSEWTKH